MCVNADTAHAWEGSLPPHAKCPLDIQPLFCLPSDQVIDQRCCGLKLCLVHSNTVVRKPIPYSNNHMQRNMRYTLEFTIKF